MAPNYPVEELSDDYDDGTMPRNVADLADAVVGHRIVSVEKKDGNKYAPNWADTIITLDNGKQVTLAPGGDCCAYTELKEFFLHPEAVDHLIMGVGTTDEYSTWHIYADFGDIMEMKVDWSAGNTGYYGYGFYIEVEDI